MLIERKPLRADVRDAVVDLLITGDLAPGTRIKEGNLAERLGVSRTPVREALLNLEQQGFVRGDMARGFSVLPLTTEEVSETYPILWTLETFALRSAESDIIDVTKLRRINERIAASKSPEKTKNLDERWHATLLAANHNARLAVMIDDLKLLLRRYEHAYMLDKGLVSTSVAQHAEMADIFETGDIERVAQLVEAHWRFGMERILAWLQQR